MEHSRSDDSKRAGSTLRSAKDRLRIHSAENARMSGSGTQETTSPALRDGCFRSESGPAAHRLGGRLMTRCGLEPFIPDCSKFRGMHAQMRDRAAALLRFCLTKNLEIQARGARTAAPADTNIHGWSKESPD